MLEFDKSDLYRGFHLDPTKDADIEMFHEKMSPKSRQIKKTIENDGSLYVMSVKSDPIHETIVEVFGSIFYQDGTIKNLMQTLEFEHTAKEDIERILARKEQQLQDLKEITALEQETLPKNFRDDSKIASIEQKLEDLKERRDNIYSASIYNHDLLLIQCGRFIKYTTVNETMFNDDKDSANVFRDAAINFDKSVEISKIWTTVTSHILQIIAVDNEKKVMLVVTWDFDNNIEVSML